MYQIIHLYYYFIGTAQAIKHMLLNAFEKPVFTCTGHKYSFLCTFDSLPNAEKIVL